MIVPYRAQLEQQEGGYWLVLALQQIVNAISVTPISVGDARIHSGNGSPLNVLVGNRGDLYLRRDGGTTTTLYVKEGADFTSAGWVPK
jgi:hypothetical protein